MQINNRSWALRNAEREVGNFYWTTFRVENCGGRLFQLIYISIFFINQNLNPMMHVYLLNEEAQSILNYSNKNRIGVSSLLSLLWWIWIFGLIFVHCFLLLCWILICIKLYSLLFSVTRKVSVNSIELIYFFTFLVLFWFVFWFAVTHFSLHLSSVFKE